MAKRRAVAEEVHHDHHHDYVPVYRGQEPSVSWGSIRGGVVFIGLVVAQTAGLTALFLRTEANIRSETQALRQAVENNAILFEKKLSDLRTERSDRFVTKEEYNESQRKLEQGVMDLTKGMARVEGILSTHQGGSVAKGDR